MAEPTSDTLPRVRRGRWPRFSLRLLLVIVTLVAVWLAVTSQRARSQKLAIAEVERLGGFLGFDYQFDAGMKWRKDPQLPVPIWMVDLIGEDCARSVLIVNFDDGSDPNNDDLKVVERLDDLKELTLMNRTKITDEGLRHVAGLAELEVLAINGTNVTGDGLSYLRNCRKLKGLPMSDTPLTDAGLSHISHLQQLEWLQLNGTQITDEGLSQLSGLTNLESLQLRDTSITDRGLEHLSSLKSLKELLLRGTETTTKGRSMLQRELPKCSVTD